MHAIRQNCGRYFTLMTEQKKKYYSIGFLLLIHLVGVLGFHTQYSELFKQATFFHLLISTIIVMYHHQSWNKNFIAFMVVAFTTGFVVEVVGVATGNVFGEYQYGKTLGFKIFDVPIIIGVNWLLLVYIIGTILDRLQANIFVKSLLGAGILVFMDVFIEPVAIQFDYWSWSSEDIPFMNYFGWYIVGTVLLLTFYLFNFKKQNQLAIPLFLIQLAFFTLINLTIIE